MYTINHNRIMHERNSRRSNPPSTTNCKQLKNSFGSAFKSFVVTNAVENENVAQPADPPPPPYTFSLHPAACCATCCRRRNARHSDDRFHRRTRVLFFFFFFENPAYIRAEIRRYIVTTFHAHFSLNFCLLGTSWRVQYSRKQLHTYLRYNLVWSIRDLVPRSNQNWHIQKLVSLCTLIHLE